MNLAKVLTEKAVEQPQPAAMGWAQPLAASFQVAKDATCLEMVVPPSLNVAIVERETSQQVGGTLMDNLMRVCMYVYIYI